MKRLTIFPLLLLISYCALGKTEEKLSSGTCNGGNVDTWWCVITYVDGRPTKMSGRNCRGVMYWNVPINGHTVSSNPILGMIPTDEGVDGNGIQWQAVMLANDNGYPYWMGGANTAGDYWVADSFGTLFE